MTARSLALLALLALQATACRTPNAARGSVLVTDETKGALLNVCRDVFADHDAEARLANLCRCLDGKRGEPGLAPLVSRYCDDGGGRAFYSRLEALLVFEGEDVMRSTAGAAPTAEDKQCVAELAASHVEVEIELAAKACRTGDLAALRSLLTLPRAETQERCVRLRRMNEDECFVSGPCDDLSKAAEAPLCNATAQSMHRLKDPRRANLLYNYAFANLLGRNRSSANVTYGAANCHGTAQAFAGDALADLPVTGLSFHSDTVEAQCRAEAQTAFDAAATKSGKSLPIGRGGYVVNMNHDPSCPASACGEVTFHTFSCTDGLEAHVFVNGMCVNCWDAKLRAAGLAPLPPDATWEALRPGCILTAPDHTITTMLMNDGLCYYYESLSPFAPPQLSVKTCAGLFARFPRRWCPAPGRELTLRPSP